MSSIFMNAQELYNHLNKLQTMFEENKIMFDDENIGEIVSEVIDETLNENFEWKENGEVIYRGSNPEIIVDRVAITTVVNDE